MITHYVFDAYGTLFDVHSAAARHKAEIGEHWDRMSQVWRAKHLEYTWIYGAIGRNKTFWELTADSLDTAAATVGGIDAGARARLLQAYRTLDAYPEVPAVLAGLKAKGATTAILSNGDPDMLADAVASAGLGRHLDAVLSVAEAGTFKPAFRVYELVGRRFGVDASNVSFQSSNRWDAAAAKAFGFRAVWVNRTGAPAEYKDLAPDREARDLNVLLSA